MDNNNLKFILQDELEKEIPSAQIDLWPAVKQHLVARKHTLFQQGEKMNTTRSRHLPRTAFVILTIIVLLVAAFLTPQGQAWAQGILQFFKRAESYVIPLPPEQIASAGDAQAVPTQPPAQFVGMAEAEKSSGFDAKELSSTPDGFSYLGAMAGEGSISIQYEALGGGGALVINESTNGFMQSEWDQAPEEFISPAKIGDLDAEIVQGAYVVYPGETSARWNPDVPILRLRWLEDGIWFEMAKFGGVESIAYLDQGGLLALAESLH